MLHPEMYYFVQKECTPGAWHAENHRISNYSLVFVMEGGAHYTIDGQNYEPKVGNVIFIKPGGVRSYSTEGMRCTAIDFRLPEGENIEMDTMQLRSDLDEFSRLFQEIRYEWLQKRTGYEMKCQGLFALVLHRLLYEEDPGRRNLHVEAIRRYILAHYCEEITVQSLAQRQGLNPVYCGALFRREEGCTIAAFISRVRINKAADLLRTGEYTVGEVAERVGFKDIYYFSNTFKKQMGISPIHYLNL